jgi:hypothetical protein
LKREMMSRQPCWRSPKETAPHTEAVVWKTQPPPQRARAGTKGNGDPRLNTESFVGAIGRIREATAV